MSTSTRAPRSDLVRNRARLVAAARQVYETHGSAFTVDEVAAVAGVGVGTFYRHFRTRAALLEEMIGEQLGELAAIVVPEADPTEALFAFIEEALLRAPAKLDLLAALGSSATEHTPELQRIAHQLRERVARALNRAQDAGTIRRELAADDLLTLLSAAMTACAQADDQRQRAERITAILCAGLSAAAP